MTCNVTNDSTVVLVVEDEPLVQVLTCEILEEAGFTVLAAWNANEALQVLDREAGHVQVLFTDVDMPGAMDGLALAEEVHNRWPEIQLLISSGLARPSPDRIPDDGHFITKPYRPTEIVDHIQQLMAQT